MASQDYWPPPRMPFGKYKGEPLDNIPDDYLRWLLGRDLREPLLSSIRHEFQRRAFHEQQRQQHTSDQQTSNTRRRGLPSRVDIDALITSGLKALARRFHPDLPGGNLERMQAINHAADWLRGRIRELL